MPNLMIELAVGDVLVVGDKTLTVIDVDGDEVSFRIDPAPPETRLHSESASAASAASENGSGESAESSAADLLEASEVSIGRVRIAGDPTPPRRAK